LFFVPVTISPISVNRANTLRGREAIAAFFAQKRNIRLPNECVIRAAYTSQPSADPGLKFIIVVSKRIARRAHDRNQLKRWVRAAIGQIPLFAEIDAHARDAGRELILLISPSAAPSKSVNWESILSSVQATAEKTQSSVLSPQSPALSPQPSLSP
jgi:ribonuclease P protein component